MQIDSSLYSVVVPVFNSEGILQVTVKRIVDFFESRNLKYEVILVNDGSRDNSWAKIVELTKENKTIKAINFLKNYGQHTALFCGIKYSMGDYVITLDRVMT